jgi:hypothetical protein
MRKVATEMIMAWKWQKEKEDRAAKLHSIDGGVPTNISFSAAGD